jgi:anti-anti-sigma factor
VSTYELEHHQPDESGVEVVALAGELDLTNASGLERRLETEVRSDAPLVVDLNRVVFIDSAALHCFFRLARARGRSRLALVVEPAAPIARALGIVDLGGAVTVAPTLEAARAALIGAQTT